jgi:hypothetical protein
MRFLRECLTRTVRTACGSDRFTVEVLGLNNKRSTARYRRRLCPH